MRIHIIQHVAFEGPGSLLPIFEAAGDSVAYTKLFAGEQLPAVDDLDWLVVMGGPMGVNDEKQYPWLGPEKAFIREVIEAEKIVLGICLGSQLIAAALGARVRRNPLPEIGWFPVTFSPEAKDFGFPEKMTVFHWHGDTFDLPSGAVVLAKSEGCLNQAFSLGNRVLALQFHPEATAQTVQGMISHCGHELVAGEFIQSAKELAAEHSHWSESLSCTRRIVESLRSQDFGRSKKS